MQVSSLLSADESKTPKMPPAKSISFELLLDEGSKTRARIPLRVVLNTHDSTESIITTVKNFYGIYDGNGVSFEDSWGNTLIPSYDNLVPDSTVYVRIVPAIQPASAVFPHGAHGLENGYEPRRRPSLGEPFQMLPPHMREQSHSPSRPSSRLARKRSISPTQGRGRRSASQQKGPGIVPLSRGSSANGSFHDDNGYSDSEAGRSSISGSKKARSEQFASSDISTANVLQDGRRGQSIFDSSALPLFVPPQVPITASQSSISPQRRSLPQEVPSPFHPPAQKLYGLQQHPILSPQSYGPSHNMDAPADHGAGAGMATPVPQHHHRLRDRSAMQQNQTGTQGYSRNGVLPTPDPTVASCISDEDVARTLIALGDASNYSHGRTSNSTIDETFSGAADAASSTGATSDSDEYSDAEGGLPKYRKYLDDEDEQYDQANTEHDVDEYDGPPKTKKIKTKMHDGPTNGYATKADSMKNNKSSKARSNTLPKAAKTTTQPGLMKAPSAPASGGQARKSSGSSINFQHQLAADEEDLSSKPRCQRCRKSKKGCDRQRPCGRCRDAGIGIEGCISEDEGGSRKGRYGRHMGVPVKKGVDQMGHEEDPDTTMTSLPAEGVAVHGSPEKSKKRKR
ncbi:hypothetical protein HRR83_006920 [Exophiala dermatitidis]|uniref:Zn(2)-C6 fungal-type domain-containing protein n=1 Tax=Exophiala dermatitidis TaxID=5970 RepID=A0AAN6IWF7_EXODE|nr:hypothetical protein HRR73_005959 [Exophiala dermatitidis]KAJ4512722.1 hypothetical protein HRR74_006420 [Exophiala dermatitidis]KAJ4542526.1 hypothetical protein HRR77_005724 [Exophiala dermatitidis]KAJ4548215.1 hypothetical protein HRR76_000822 [Exophiala dermatitidis]KAJ4570252.1 hypothetical protein HRR82_007461 [Exophiala dermatitidis]